MVLCYHVGRPECRTRGNQRCEISGDVLLGVRSTFSGDNIYIYCKMPISRKGLSNNLVTDFGRLEWGCKWALFYTFASTPRNMGREFYFRARVIQLLQYYARSLRFIEKHSTLDTTKLSTERWDEVSSKYFSTLLMIILDSPWHWECMWILSWLKPWE